MTTKILSVGGSMIAPDKPDVDFLAAFVKMAKEWLAADSGRRLILVAGGGAPARVYQNAYKERRRSRPRLPKRLQGSLPKAWRGL